MATIELAGLFGVIAEAGSLGLHGASRHPSEKLDTNRFVAQSLLAFFGCVRSLGNTEGQVSYTWPSFFGWHPRVGYGGPSRKFSELLDWRLCDIEIACFCYA